MTDLCVDKDGLVVHAPFDPSGPGTIKWLHHRLKKVHKHVDKNANHIQNALMGQPALANDNGLGFDHGRLGASSDKTDRLVNPVVEVLAFFGLSLLPARGPGGDRCLDRFANITVRQKGWLMHERRQKFHWPAWEQPLDCNGIDALLDTWQPSSKSRWALLGIFSAWRSVEYESDGDYTQAFGSERI
ncbi:MAG: hypothetical protein OXC13_18360 [Caldilineaceae bacterium]|nr:hypothetical protein [Caldilineaceae bacterium]